MSLFSQIVISKRMITQPWQAADEAWSEKLWLGNQLNMIAFLLGHNLPTQRQTSQMSVSVYINHSRHMQAY